MPRAKMIKKEQILERAFSIVKEEGENELTARRLAKDLGCSTQPIYKEYEDMDALKAAVAERSYLMMCDLTKEFEQKYRDELLASVLGYVRFSFDYKKLFQLLFLRYGIGIKRAKKLMSESDKDIKDLLIYANGIVVMNAFHTIEESWEQVEALILTFYESKKR